MKAIIDEDNEDDGVKLRVIFLILVKMLKANPPYTLFRHRGLKEE